ncbi:MAG: heavy metal-binding domain-containing protein [Thermoplasmata archaeon]|nr:heavy metal-binding domain-containing protein [Thermoplasmata archaeon]
MTAATATPLASPNPYAPPTDLIIVTTPFVSGYHVTRMIGATFGLIVRSRGLGQNLFAFFRAWGGGEIKVYTQLLERVRHEAIERLAAHAKSLGANAVVAVGFDTSEMAGAMTEVLAYGTAVVVEPDTTPAQPVSLH